jgi:zinc and cadmium transporter
MGTAAALVVYCLGIVAGSLLGGLVPLVADVRRRMDVLLALAAGVMLGAAFFHMLPEAVHQAGVRSLAVVPLGFFTLYTLERFVLVHACQEPVEGCEVHGTMGLSSFLGLSVHTLFDGAALGAALSAGLGGMVFLAVVAHHIPASLSLSSILVHEGRSARRVLTMILALALMVPVGALAYFALRGGFEVAKLTSWALAFSAGTFLHIALADLLPQAHRKASSRLPMVLSLAFGAAAMWALELLHTGH